MYIHVNETCVCMYVWTHKHIQKFICLVCHTCLCIIIITLNLILTCTINVFMYKCTYLGVFISTYVYVYILTYKQINKRTDIRTYVAMYLHTYIHNKNLIRLFILILIRYAVILKCWKTDVDERLSFKDIVEELCSLSNYL